MAKVFSLLAVIVTLVAAPIGALAGDPTIEPGIYDGKVTQIGGTKWSDFRIDLRNPKGSITMTRSECFRPQPIKVVSDDKGVRLESKEGVGPGCTRVFRDLVITVNGFTAVMDGPLNTFKATAERVKE